MPDTAWKETRPGRWERPLSCIEKINLLDRNVDKAPDRDNWAKTAVATFEFAPSLGDPETALRIAWKQVRYNYPEVAAFPYNGMYMYRVGNPDQVDLWVTATFSVAEKTTVDQLLGHIPRNEQMMCYYLPDTSEVLIRSPHYRLDARGAIFCLNFLIESLENLNFKLVFGGCAENLSPSIDNALDIPLESTSSIEDAANKRMEGLKPHHPPLNLTPTRQSKIPGATRRRFIKLSKKETEAIVAGCKDASLHYTAVLHSALVQAVAKLAPPSEMTSFMASLHCDLRLLIQKPVTTKRAPTSCTSVLTTEVEVSPSTDFRSYYAQLAPTYASGYGPHLESTACFHEKLAACFQNGKPPGDYDGQPQPRFGPLGVMDDQLTKEVGQGLIRVKDFWLGAETLTRRKMVHSWIWDDEQVLSCCYNENFWEDDFVEQLLSTMKDTLIEEVALQTLLANVQI